MNKKGVMKNVIFLVVVIGVLSLVGVSAAPWPGAGTVEGPYEIRNCTGLQNMSLNLSAYFKLTATVDCSDTINWNGGDGFDPVGNDIDKFTGGFDGQNYTITGLFINRSIDDYIGLFGYVDGVNITNVGLTSADVKGDDYVGVLVGYNYNSTVDNSYTTGDVSGDNYIGGLVGYHGSSSDIDNSYSEGSVSGTWDIGGLIGQSELSSTINNSYTTGDVSGDNYIGGLVGHQRDGSRIDNSYATGNVYGILEVGGLVGKNRNSTINSSYATGNVDGSGSIGGLIGYNYEAIADNSYATGNVGGVEFIGGLVGQSFKSNISSSYAVGDATGDGYIGGLVGRVFHGNISYSFSVGAVNGNSNEGGFVGSAIGTIDINNVYWYNNTGDDVSVCIGNIISHTCNDGAKTDVTYFYNVGNAPLSSWGFPPWNSTCDNEGFPSLEWQGLVSEVLCLGYVAPVVVSPVSGSSGGGGGCIRDLDYDWKCSEWTTCVEGEQTRTCLEKNNCGNNWDRPNITRACVGGVSPEQLFDIRMELQNTLLSKASDLEAIVSFFSFGTIPTSVDLIYIILDDKGGEIYRETGDVTVITQEVLRKTFEELEFPDGKYVFVLNTLYGDDVFDEFSQDFEVKSSWLWLWIVIIILVIGMIVGSVIYFRKIRTRKTR
jgi:hypothetical protein